MSRTSSNAGGSARHLVAINVSSHKNGGGGLIIQSAFNPNPTINLCIQAADLSLWSIVSINRFTWGATEKRSTW